MKNKKIPVQHDYCIQGTIYIEPGIEDDVFDVLCYDIVGFLPESFARTTGESRFCHEHTLAFNCLANISVIKKIDRINIIVGVSKYIQDNYIRCGNPRYINLALPYIKKFGNRLFNDLSDMYTISVEELYLCFNKDL